MFRLRSAQNKLYLCRKDYAPEYRAALKTPFLLHYFSKSYRSQNAEIDCYRLAPFKQDEEPAKNAIGFMLKMFRPDIFLALKNKGRRTAT